MINGNDWRHRNVSRPGIPTTIGEGAAAERRIVTDPTKPTVIIAGRDFHDTQIRLRNKEDRVIFREPPTKNINIISDYPPNIQFEFEEGRSDVSMNSKKDQIVRWSSRDNDNRFHGRVGQTHDTYSFNNEPLVNVYYDNTVT
ncbi:hypothetical protein CS022_07765 [Veronia nyctiphanis]|uniref:Uncharacterized protein n=1 Tax=Veronia nyctiphanis TaxID=1278244 RepID=A0A4Q0YX52_9GAMM|nr:hypothetical protein CS022_07765 [Veronia nyctiphanis]